jgi:hypothetical protein
MSNVQNTKNYYYLKSKHRFTGTFYEFPFMSLDETNLFAEFFNPILQLYPIDKSVTTLLPLDVLFQHLRLFILEQLNWND